MSRRTLLGTSAAAVAAAYVARFSTTPVARYLDGVAARLADLGEVVPHQNGAPIAFTVERDADLLLLDVTFYGFNLDTTSDPVALVPLASDSEIVVQFPPQAIGEAAYPYVASGAEFDPPPVLSVLSGPSQLVFNLPDGATVPLTTMTVDDLLDWSTWTLVVPAVATIAQPVVGTSVPPIPIPMSPSGTTLIECPYGLYLSPVVNETVTESGPVTTSYQTTFTPTVQPAASDAVTECWTATLGYTEVATVSIAASDPHAARSPAVFSSSSTPLEPLVSAVWSRDLQLYAVGTGSFDWVPWSTSTLDQPAYYATPFDQSTGMTKLISIPEDE